MARRKTRRAQARRKRNQTPAYRMTRMLRVSAVVLVVAIVAVAADLVLRPAPEDAAIWGGSRPRPTPSANSSSAPAVAAAPDDGTPPRCVVPSDWGIHIVATGDSLFALAQQYGATVPALRRANCLDNSTIFAGQQLYVPGPLALPTHPTATSAVVVAAQRTATPQVELTAETAAEPVALLPTPVVGGLEPPAFQLNIPDRYLHVLLLGVDKRYRGKPQTVWRSDAIIIVSVDTEQKVVRLLHIPRDLWVYIPGYGEHKINTAYLWGELDKEGTGPEWVKETIFHNLGIPIHYYAVVDFLGFVKIIDALGGVDIDVDCPLPEINLQPGIQHLDGETALEYVHRRDTTSDFDRGVRQRKMLMALKEQFLTPSIIPKLPVLWTTLSEYFKTDMPLDQVIRLAQFGLQLEPQRIRMRDIDRTMVRDWMSPGGTMALLLKEDVAREWLENFYAPVDTSQLDKTSKVRVQVLNGSQRSQAEELAAAMLQREGFRVVDKGPAGAQDHARTVIVVKKGDPAVGAQIAEQLGVPLTAVQDETAIPEPPDQSNPLAVRIILGRDYDPCQR